MVRCVISYELTVFLIRLIRFQVHLARREGLPRPVGVQTRALHQRWENRPQRTRPRICSLWAWPKVCPPTYPNPHPLNEPNALQDLSWTPPCNGDTLVDCSGFVGGI